MIHPGNNFPESGPPEFRQNDAKNGGNSGNHGRSGRRRTPDREIPIYTPGQAGRDQSSGDLLNRWLDGEVNDSAMLSTVDGDDTVDLWNKIHDEAELLRNRTTPLYVHKRIMDSLPDNLYQKRLPWYRKPVALHPLLLVLLALGFAAVGVVVARMLIQ